MTISVKIKRRKRNSCSVSHSFNNSYSGMNVNTYYIQGHVNDAVKLVASILLYFKMKKIKQHRTFYKIY